MIGLVDGNNFFVSCERVFDPSLEGKPVAVLSNNDGCVISRSYELKALDVPMGMPWFQLRKLVDRHGIVVRSSNYELYGDLSRRVIAVLREFSDRVEQYSIDEAFVHAAISDPEECLRFGREVRKAVLEWVGIPCGVGFAPTKTLAKIANHIGKKAPGGVYALPADPSPVLERIPVGEVWGVGRRLAPQLEAIGLRTARDLAEADEGELARRFSVVVARTASELRGVPAVDGAAVEPAQRSITCSRSFGRPVTEFEELRQSVALYLAEAAEKLRSERLKATSATVYCQFYPEYEPTRREGGADSVLVPFERPTSSTPELVKRTAPFLEAIFRRGRRYKKTGVILSCLDGDDGEQADLFADTRKEERADRLSAAMDRINGRFGKGTLFSPAQGIEKPWRMKRSFLSPAWTTNWDEIPEVR